MWRSTLMRKARRTRAWTMIYDEGFEVNVNDHKCFAFSYFKKGSTEHHKKSVCHKTFPGWYHNAKNPDGVSWGCYHAMKEGGEEDDSMETEHFIEENESKSAKEYKPEHDLVAHINSKKSTWKAKVYPEFSGRKMHELHAMGGGRTFHEPHYRARDAPGGIDMIQEKSSGNDGQTNAQKDTIGVHHGVDVSDLPKQLDWRNKDGHNYITPVVNQGSCGSCYAVAVTDMIQTRARDDQEPREAETQRAEGALVQRVFARMQRRLPLPRRQVCSGFRHGAAEEPAIRRPARCEM